MQKFVYKQDDKLEAFRSLTREQQAVLKAAQQDGAMQAVDSEEAPDQKDFRAAQTRYYAYQTAMGGTSDVVGPLIDVSAGALQMQRVEEDGEEVFASKKYSREQVKRRMKPYQVNGTA